MNRVESWWWSKLKLKRQEENLKILTYLFSAHIPWILYYDLPEILVNDVPLLEGERSMTDEIFPIPDLYYEMKVQAISP